MTDPKNITKPGKPETKPIVPPEPPDHNHELDEPEMLDEPEDIDEPYEEPEPGEGP